MSETTDANRSDSDERERALLQSCWFPVAFESTLDEPLGVELLGRRLVVARFGSGDDARVAAFPDRCPHRGAVLSDGCLTAAPDGTATLACPYHGLQFDGDGLPVHLPGRPDDRLAARLALDPVQVEVRHGVVWVCPSGEPITPIPDWSAVAQPTTIGFELGPMAWSVAASRAVENFTDLAHFATVHAATFGDPVHPEIPEYRVEVDGPVMRHEAIVYQLDRLTLDGPLEPVPVRFAYTTVLPFSSELILYYPGDRTEWIQFGVWPVNDTECRVLQRNVRDFDLDDPVEDWRDFQIAIGFEDQRVLEQLRPALVRLDGHGADEVGLPFDAATTAYRSMWRSMLAG